MGILPDQYLPDTCGLAVKGHQNTALWWNLCCGYWRGRRPSSLILEANWEILWYYNFVTLYNTMRQSGLLCLTWNLLLRGEVMCRLPNINSEGVWWWWNNDIYSSGLHNSLISAYVLVTWVLSCKLWTFLKWFLYIQGLNTARWMYIFSHTYHTTSSCLVHCGHIVPFHLKTASAISSKELMEHMILQIR